MRPAALCYCLAAKGLVSLEAMHTTLSMDDVDKLAIAYVLLQPQEKE